MYYFISIYSISGIVSKTLQWKLSETMTHRVWWLWKMPKGKPGSYLVGGIPTPLKNMSSSVGVTYDGKNKIHVPNHQPVFLFGSYSWRDNLGCGVDEASMGDGTIVVWNPDFFWPRNWPKLIFDASNGNHQEKWKFSPNVMGMSLDKQQFQMECVWRWGKPPDFGTSYEKRDKQNHIVTQL